MSKGHKEWHDDNDHPMLGKTHSEETRKRISEIQIGRKASEKTKQRMSQSQKESYLSGKRNHPEHSYAKNGFRDDIGHFVRSTWEANIARILIYENIVYEYEPKTFDLGEMTYLPDFFIPSKNLYIEVKGYMSDKAKKQIELFNKNYWLMVIDETYYNELSDCYKSLLNNWES